MQLHYVYILLQVRIMALPFSDSAAVLAEVIVPAVTAASSSSSESPLTVTFTQQQMQTVLSADRTAADLYLAAHITAAGKHDAADIQLSEYVLSLKQCR
jgi:hypothetical protein